MGVKLKGGFDSFYKAFDEAERIMAEEIQLGLSHLGEECVKRIRERTIEEGSWRDQTGNLRSSIGYAVMDHGYKAISSAFGTVVGPNGDGNQGAEIGKRYVNELASQYAEVYALVVVAGMDYAKPLEAKGIDVLSGTQLWAEAEVEKYMKVYVGRAERRIKALLKKI